MIRRVSLRRKLILAYVLVLLPILALLLYNYEDEYQYRQQQLLDGQMRTAQAVGAMVVSTFNQNLDLASAMAHDPTIRTMNPQVTDSYLQALASSDPEHLDMGVFDAQGESRGESLPYAPGQQRISIADRDYFQQVMSTGKPVVSNVLINKRTNEPAVAIATPVIGSSGKPEGAFVIVLALNYFHAQLQSVGLAPGQAILLADKTGRLALNTNQPNISWDKRDISSWAPMQAALKGQTVKDPSLQSPFTGDQCMGAFTPTSSYGWVVGITIPTGMALNPARQVLITNLLALAGMSLFSGLVATALATFLLNPLRRLTEHIAAFGRGEPASPSNIHTGDELEELGQSFDTMAGQLTSRMEENEKLAAELRAANERLIAQTLRTQELAHESERHARMVEATIESMADGVLVVSAEGVVVDANRAAVDMYGLPPKDILVPLDQLRRNLHIRQIDGRDLTAEQSVLEGALRGETLMGQQEIIRGKGGQDLYISISAAPVIDEDGRVYRAVGVMQDVTHVIQLERMRDEFLATAAHELKTPVTTIKGYAQLMKRWAPQGHEPREAAAFEVVNRQCDRLNRVVQEMLEASRFGFEQLELHREVFDLGELVEEVADRARPITTRHRFIIDRRDVAMVAADRDRIEQVLANLIDNAVKFTPEGGDVHVAVTAGEGIATVSVSDTGVGIPADKQGRIFERFYRAHAGTPFDYGGMGMGLFISREVALRHGGDICFESEEGKGSTFYFTLPLAKGGSDGHGQ